MNTRSRRSGGTKKVSRTDARYKQSGRMKREVHYVGFFECMGHRRVVGAGDPRNSNYVRKDVAEGRTARSAGNLRHSRTANDNQWRHHYPADARAVPRTLFGADVV